MSHTPNYDKKVQEILASTKPGERTCALTGEKWMMDEREIGWYKKFNVPPSKMHPHTRWQLAIGQYIGYQWWWNKLPETGKPLLATTLPATGLKVLSDKEWYAKDFANGFTYEVNKPFFEQWRQLQLATPVTASHNFVEVENSIAAVSHGAINSYFTLASTSRDSLFTVNTESERSCLINWSSGIQDSYMVSDAHNVFSSSYVLDSDAISHSDFVFGSDDLEFCFGASNQKHKKYLWFDEQLTESEWKKRRAAVDFSSRSKLQALEDTFFRWLDTEVVWPEIMTVNSPGCTGEYLVQCLDCVHSYSCAWGVRDCYWVIHNYDRSERCAFLVGGATCEDVYYSVSNKDCSNVKFSGYLKECEDVEYSMNCENCEDCFGCVGLRHKKFHIFNKGYSEEEYWKRLDELKCAMLDRGEYGEFFPISFSPSYQPYGGGPIFLHTTPEELTQLWALEFDPESQDATGELLSRAQNPTPSSQIPDGVDAHPEQWIGKPMLDEKNHRRFTYLASEVEFYQKHGLPLPEEHFIHRILKLYSLSNAALFEERHCEKCKKRVTIAHNSVFPNRKIYCISCYHAFCSSR